MILTCKSNTMISSQILQVFLRHNLEKETATHATHLFNTNIICSQLTRQSENLNCWIMKLLSSVIKDLRCFQVVEKIFSNTVYQSVTIQKSKTKYRFLINLGHVGDFKSSLLLITNGVYITESALSDSGGFIRKNMSYGSGEYNFQRSPYHRSARPAETNNFQIKHLLSINS